MRHNYEEILKEIETQGISIHKYCKKHNLSYATIINGLNKCKAAKNLTIHKVEDDQPTAIGKIEISYGKVTITVNSVEQLQIVLRTIDNV